MDSTSFGFKVSAGEGQREGSSEAWFLVWGEAERCLKEGMRRLLGLAKVAEAFGY